MWSIVAKDTLKVCSYYIAVVSQKKSQKNLKIKLIWLATSDKMFGNWESWWRGVEDGLCGQSTKPTIAHPKSGAAAQTDKNFRRERIKEFWVCYNSISVHLKQRCQKQNKSGQVALNGHGVYPIDSYHTFRFFLCICKLFLRVFLTLWTDAFR